MRCPTLTRSRKLPTRALSTLMLLTLAACGSEEPEWHSLEPASFGDDQLVFEWAPGSAETDPASLRVRLLERDSESIIYEGSVANDGVDIGYDNVLPQIDRPPEIVMCLNGSQQTDLHVRINTKVGTVIEAQRVCTQ